MNQQTISFNWRKAGAFFLFFMALTIITKASSPDSLRVRWINGQKYVLHKVAPKETYSSLSRRYNVSVADLQKANPGVDGLKIGQIINIPAVPSSANDSPAPTASQEAPKKPAPAPVKNSSGSTIHTVQKGETLYRISKMYNMSVDDLKALNGLTSNNVSVGQKLKVQPGTAQPGVIKETPRADEPAPRQEPAPEPMKEQAPPPPVPVKVQQAPPVKEPIREPVEAPKETPRPEPVKEEPKPVAPEESPKPSNGDELPKVYSNPGTTRTSTLEKDPKTGTTVEKIVEVGVAAWMNEGDLNQNKFYALHRTAPVGTIIKVTNRMNNNSVFVKVVGVLPETGDNSNVLIKITQAAAQRIGALDQKFTAELSYGISK
ncbi:MAG: LysM peptidoglycan-binding domain-containing protein [Bacteroidia bacterium]